MSPYRCQVQHFIDSLRSAQQEGSLVTTVRKVQGAECQVGISTTAMNNLQQVTQIGFIHEKEMLNVWNSRQQCFNFMISPWPRRSAALKTIEDSHHSKKDYVAWIDMITGPANTGSIVLRSEDFATFPGFAALVVVSMPPAAPAVAPGFGPGLTVRVRNLAINH
ncbi:hypothetical protein MRB53_039532 [Persea americana]|nr:hypothetical protein MRB53_039532 [Persea americana]